MDKENITLNVNDTENLSATINPSDASNKDITWISSNSDIVTINEGFITAISPGTAIVTAQSSNNIIDTCQVVVIEKKEIFNFNGNMLMWGYFILVIGFFVYLKILIKKR